ncbi:nitrous oxide reductase family maturation protein NosD [Chelatococcus daeguensis]|uniref:nitrous oxide reductase family maturation protein NosD n=1 Tax=Chelatococcus daeguensis TaxID=444444 RepID=UPI000B18FFFF|nr:nitrous oxide reductase family maturation protein NosD [Chelatococcus daeguensis]MBM3083607.1 nitrous oxide reductase family maturation protein NosD [Chelatococcus daeguensis]
MCALATILRSLPAAALAAGLSSAAAAGEIVVSPGEALQAALDRAEPGDILRLQPGVHRGPVTIGRAVTLDGQDAATVAGSGEGSVITVTVPGVTVRRLTVRGSGRSLETLDSGILLTRTAAGGALVEHNRIENNLFGVYVHGAAGALVRDNVIVGQTSGRSSEAGNGVSVWNAPGARIIGNDISFGRDGIMVMSSRDNVFRGNRFHNLRFGVHYMYTNNSEVSGNISRGNAIGFAIMFSNRLTVRDNLSDGDRDHGLLFNYANGSVIAGNVVRGRMLPATRWRDAGLSADAGEHGLPVGGAEAREADGAARTGPEKCVFIYNANNNRFESNRFEGCETGIHFTAGSEGNAMTGNAFIRNRTQVKYVGTRFLDWSKDGRGNYWSDNPAFDLDGDGIADIAYRPNGIVDRVLWTAPQAKVLLNSPAVQVIRWAQSQFPALYPGGVVDSRPLMAPPAPPPHLPQGDRS